MAKKDPRSDAPHPSLFWDKKLFPTKKQAAKAAVRWSDDCIRNNAPKATRAYWFASAFEGYSLTNLSGFGVAGYMTDLSYDGVQVPILVNKVRSLVHTFVSKIAANDTPAAQLVTNGVDYDQKLRAENLDELLMAESSMRHGMFANAAELDRHGVTLATSSTPEYWVFALPGEGKVELELDDGLAIGVVKESQFGRIVTLSRSTMRDPEVLIARYPKHEKAILANVEYVDPPIVAGGSSDGNKTLHRNRLGNSEKIRQVRLIQAWRVQLNEDNPGREIFALKDGTSLEDNVFEFDEPPGDSWCFERELGGGGGTPLTQTIYRISMRFNELVNAVDTWEQNTPDQLLLCKAGTPEGQQLKGQLKQVKSVMIVDVDGDPNSAVKQIDNSKLPHQKMELIAFYGQQCHEVPGISQAQTSGNKAAGTTSGIHEVYSASYFTERFADAERRLVEFRTVTRAKKMLRAMKHVADDRYSRWVGQGKRRRQLTPDDFDLDESRYDIAVKPASEEKDSPQTRLKKAEQWLKDPTIPFIGADMLGFHKTFDVDRAAEILNSIDRVVEEQCSSWRRDAVDTLAKSYVPPMKWWRIPGLESALRIVAVDHANAIMDRVPRERLAYFEKFADTCVELIYQLKRREAELMQPPKPAGATNGSTPVTDTAAIPIPAGSSAPGGGGPGPIV